MSDAVAVVAGRRCCRANLNKRPKLGSGQRALNVHNWVLGAQLSNPTHMIL